MREVALLLRHTHEMRLTEYAIEAPPCTTTSVVRIPVCQRTKSHQSDFYHSQDRTNGEIAQGCY